MLRSYSAAKEARGRDTGGCMRLTTRIAALAGPFLASALAAPAAARADAGCTGRASDTRLLVRVEGVRSSSGLVAVTLYANNPRKFLARHGSLYVGRVPARQGVTEVCIFVPQPGIYAVAVYHDADGNRKLNRNFLGYPTEGFGFSNNPNTFLGIPSFSALRFGVRSSGQRISLRLRYP
jgi:uncharacterized protein (DUF2141 family)